MFQIFISIICIHFYIPNCCTLKAVRRPHSPRTFQVAPPAKLQHFAHDSLYIFCKSKSCSYYGLKKNIKKRGTYRHHRFSKVLAHPQRTLMHMPTLAILSRICSTISSYRSMISWNEYTGNTSWISNSKNPQKDNPLKIIHINYFLQIRKSVIAFTQLLIPFRVLMHRSSNSTFPPNLKNILRNGIPHHWQWIDN